MKHVLYIHGMGGGEDSRIPSVLKEEIQTLNSMMPSRSDGIDLMVRTYDFDPETASRQIESWVEELKPVLIIGESLGAVHAIRIKGVPHILVSPALNAPYYFELLAWLTLIPGVTWIFDRIYRPKEGKRQPLHFTFRTLRKYLPYMKTALSHGSSDEVSDIHHAFFGTHDHYRRSGIVSVRTWIRHFGKSFDLYEGSHFMEDEYVRGILMDKIAELLNIKR